MNKLYFLLFFLLLSGALTAQKDLPSRQAEPGIAERTWPVDSCLYFQLPMDFRIAKVQSGPGGNTLATMQFRSSDPGGIVFQGRGRSLLDSLAVLLPGGQWSPGQTGKGTIVLPDSAFGSGPGADNFMLPMPANGFIFEIVGIVADPPLPIVLQVWDLTTED